MAIVKLTSYIEADAPLDELEQPVSLHSVPLPEGVGENPETGIVFYYGIRPKVREEFSRKMNEAREAGRYFTPVEISVDLRILKERPSTISDLKGVDMLHLGHLTTKLENRIAEIVGRDAVENGFFEWRAPRYIDRLRNVRPFSSMDLIVFPVACGEHGEYTMRGLLWRKRKVVSARILGYWPTVRIKIPLRR